MTAIYNTCAVCCAAVEPNCATQHANWHLTLDARLLEIERRLGPA